MCEKNWNCFHFISLIPNDIELLFMFINWVFTFLLWTLPSDHLSAGFSVYGYWPSYKFVANNFFWTGTLFLLFILKVSRYTQKYRVQIDLTFKRKVWIREKSESSFCCSRKTILQGRDTGFKENTAKNVSKSIKEAHLLIHTNVIFLNFVLVVFVSFLKFIINL